MNLKSAKTAINAYMSADIPCFLWGMPGVGKSDIIREIAADNKMNLIDLRAILLDPVDLRGLPTVVEVEGETEFDDYERRASWALPDFLPNETRDGEKGILFLDELNAAPQSTQAACFQLILDRRLGDYTMPNGWRIIAAGNRQGDRAAAQRMPSALANRFAHLDIDVDVDSWADWANKNDVDPRVIAFCRFRKELLANMDADSRDLRAFPTPRSWSSVARVLAALQDDKAGSGIRYEIISGIVGEGAATELEGFLRVYGQLPDIKDIFDEPTKTEIPKEISAQYAVCSAIARHVEPATFKQAIKYLERMPAEFMTMCVTDAVSSEPKIKEAPGFTSWAIENSASEYITDSYGKTYQVA